MPQIQEVAGDQSLSWDLNMSKECVFQERVKSVCLSLYTMKHYIPIIASDVLCVMPDQFNSLSYMPWT